MRNKKIHVTHIVESFGAGCLTSIATLCNILRDDFDFSIIHSLRPETPQNFRDLFPREVKFHYLPQMSAEKILANNFKAYLKLKVLLQDLTPDVLHCHSSIAGFLGRMAAIFGKLPVIYSPRGYSFLRNNSSPLARAACGALEWLATKGNSITVACGEQEYEYARRLGSENKCFFVPNAVDFKEIDSHLAKISDDSSSKLRVGTCGRLARQRNYELFAKIANHVREVSWIWLGAPQDTPLLPDFIERSGWLSRSEALSGIANLDIYAHTSAWDGLSNTLLEAMALGKPVVATDIPPNRAIIRDGVTGFLCSDEEQMTAIIKKLVANPVLRQEIGHAARKSMQEKHDAAKVYQKFASLYRRMAGARDGKI